MEFDDYNTSSSLLCEDLLPHDKRNSCSLGNDGVSVFNRSCRYYKVTILEVYFVL